MGTEMLGHWNDTVDRQGGCTEMFGTGLTQEIIKEGELRRLVTG